MEFINIKFLPDRYRCENISTATTDQQRSMLSRVSSGMETFPRYWPFVREIHRSPVDSPHKGQWRGTWIFSLICTGTNGWANNQDAGDLRPYRFHYDVTITKYSVSPGGHFRIDGVSVDIVYNSGSLPLSQDPHWVSNWSALYRCRVIN